jgi:CHAD domain-containing protein
MGGKRSRKLLARLEGLQELLGDLNDLSVATAWLISFAKFDGTPADAVMAAGAMAQSLRSRAAKLARRSVKAWRKLDKDHAVAEAISEIRRNGKQAQPTPVPVIETTTVSAS